MVVGKKTRSDEGLLSKEQGNAMLHCFERNLQMPSSKALEGGVVFGASQTQEAAGAGRGEGARRGEEITLAGTEDTTIHHTLQQL